MLLNSIVHHQIESKYDQEVRMAFFNFLRYDFPNIFKKYLLLEKLSREGVLPVDISFETLKTNSSFSASSILHNSGKGDFQDLHSLIGLGEVKREVENLVNLVKIRKIRRERNLPVSPSSLHLVFTGNPGTGKTTVARILARVFKEIGILSKGHLVEADRSVLVAEYVGQTAPKVAAKVQEALGGVLFIDEAYALTPAYKEDFGKEAINTLVPLMENYRDDLVVIMAGYTKDMQEMLDTNEGLRSRIFKIIEFHDYSLDELVEIFESICDEKGYRMVKENLNLAKSVILKEVEADPKSFGNARGVRRIFERIEMHQANRLAQMIDITDDSLMEIKSEDINPDLFRDRANS